MNDATAVSLLRHHKPRLAQFKRSLYRFFHLYERRKIMFKLARNYVRYAISMLSTVGFALSQN
jgi:hypothetical protein